MEELELNYRYRDRSNFRKIRIATIAVRMVWRCSFRKLVNDLTNAAAALEFLRIDIPYRVTGNVLHYSN